MFTRPASLDNSRVQWLARLPAAALVSVLLLLGACGGGGGGGGDDSNGEEGPAPEPFSDLTFADPLLADCLRTEAAAKGWTSAADVTDLNCAQLGIRLLRGLEALVNLQSLNLSGNPVVDLTVLEQLANLETVDLSSMPHIENIDSLSTLGALATVNLGGSAGEGGLTCASIDALADKGVSVTPPDSCLVRIVDVAFADPALEGCVLSAASEDGLAFTSDVTDLTCPQLGIVQLDDLTNFANLQTLDFSGNQVSDLAPLSGLTQLEMVNASANPISDLAPLAQAPVLRTLILNGISNRGSLDLQVLVNLAPLQNLYLDGLGQGGLPGQQGGQFDCSALDALAARLDSFSGPRGCGMPVADVAFADPALEACVFGQIFNNQFTDDWDQLNCSGAGITSLVGLERFSQLQILDLRNNPALQDLEPLSPMFSLRLLFIDGALNITSFSPLRGIPDLLAVEANNVPNLADINALVHMPNLDGVSLTNSGLAGQISCDDVNRLQANLRDFSPPAFCDTQLPPLNAPDRIRTDLDADGDADLFLEFAASSFDASAPPAAKRWGVGTNTPPPVGRFDLGGALSAFDTTAYSRARAIAAADANADGRDDLLVQLDGVDGRVHWQVLLSNGGGFGPVISATPFAGGNDARAVAFKDVNGDDRADLLIQQQRVDGLVFYYLSLAPASGAFYRAPLQVFRFDPTLGRPEIVALEDVNNDGTADFVFGRRLGNRHCFFVRTFQPDTNTFEPQSSSTACSLIEFSAEWPIRPVGVADLDGDRRAELIISIEFGLQTQWAYFPLQSGPSGSEWGSPRAFASVGLSSSGTRRTIAVADLDRDGRADLLTEVTQGTTRSWQAYLAAAPGTFERQTWLSGFSSYETLGVRDFNNDGLLDLLISIPETVAGVPTQRLYVKLNNSQTFDGPLSPWTIWYEDARRPKVLGLEEEGLTSIARDMGTLTAWTGISGGRLYTPNQLSQQLADKGMTLVKPRTFTDIDDLPLGENECKALFHTGSTDRRARGQFGVMACNVKLADGASLKLQPLYGGCESINVDSVASGAGGNCAIGSIKSELELEIGGLKQTTTVQGPSAAVCGGVSLEEFACLKAGASLVSGSQQYIVNGTGVGAGANIGVGLKGELKAADGVISGEIGGALGIGVDVQFSLNYRATGNFLVKNGETAFVFVGDNAERGMVAAGGAVYGAAKDLGNVTETAVGDAVYLAGEGAEAIAVVLKKDSLIGKTVDQIADGVDAAIDAAGGAAMFVGGAVIDIGEGIADGVGAIGSWIGSLF